MHCYKESTGSGYHNLLQSTVQKKTVIIIHVFFCKEMRKNCKIHVESFPKDMSKAGQKWSIESIFYHDDYESFENKT